MIEILGILLFWIIIFSIKCFLEEQCKVDSKYSFVLTFTSIGIIEFILGIFNLMAIGTILLVASSIFYLIYKVKNHTIKREEIGKWLKEPTHILLILLFLYITIIGYQMHLTHYDNFSHWGIIVKTMFSFDRFPTFENPYILFKGYQPGSACFLYFFGFLCGRTEGSMIVGQNYLILAYLSLFFHFLGKENKLLKTLLIICFYIFVIITSEIAFHNLLVDSLLAFMFVGTYLIWREEKKNPKKAINYMLPIMIYLFLVKNAGLLLDGILCLLILYEYYQKKELKEGFKQVCIIGGILVISLLIWQGHVTMVYGHWALNTKHSLSPQNLYHSFKVLGFDNMIHFIKSYFIHFFQLKKNIPNLFMIGLNVLGIIKIVFSKDKKKEIHQLLLLDALYIGYYFILGFMYIFSMPWEEAKVFAGYNRYMMTIVSSMIGITIYHLFQTKKLEKEKLFYGFFILLLLIPIKFYWGPFQTLLGKDDYKNSIVEKVDQILPETPLKDENYYIVLNQPYDEGYIIHMMQYKLEKNTIFIEEDYERIPDSSYIIVLDESSLDETMFQKLSEHVYQKMPR